MIKVLHAADFHLDAPFATLPPSLAGQRRREQRNALQQLANACEGCDIVLLAGDLFDGRQVYRDTLDALHACFATISAQIFIAPGNHDSICATSPYLTEKWSDNVHIFTRSTVERVELEGCHVYGAAYTAQGQEVLRDFRVSDPSVVNLMVLHSGGEYNPITESQIAASGLDYLALGHVHTRTADRAGETVYAYPGCLMGRGFDECGQKGLLRLDISTEEVQMRFLPIFSRKYELLKVTAGDDAEAAVRAALPEDAAKHAYRVTLQGESQPLYLPALQRRLADCCFHLELIDETYTPQDLWHNASEDTLHGAVMSNLRDRYEAATDEEAPRILRAAQILNALMENREVEL